MLAVYVDLAALQRNGPQSLASLAEGHYLGTGGGVIAGDYLVRAFADDCAYARQKSQRRGPRMPWEFSRDVL